MPQGQLRELFRKPATLYHTPKSPKKIRLYKPDHKNNVRRFLSKIGLNDIRTKVSELLADDFHSFLAGKLTGMEFIHPHLCIPMAKAVGTGGPSKVLDTGFGKDVGEALSGCECRNAADD